MPEITEVRKYADFLKKHLKNKYIQKINILKGRYKKKPFKITIQLPIKVLDIKTKGKFLYFILNNFENKIFFFSTLGLSGGWTFFSKSNKYTFPKLIDYINNAKINTYRKIALNNLNIEFQTDKGSIYYYDPLSFGTFKIITDEQELIKKLSTIGPDIMEETTTFELFESQLRKTINTAKPIGNVIVNQKIISGLGNYLRADILWLSRISPFRQTEDLTKKDLQIIYKNARLLTWGEFNNTNKHRHISQYKHLPRNYNRNFFVYKCDKDIYGNDVKIELLGDRKIYWVPNIQI